MTITPHLGLPLPDPSGTLEVDVTRIADAFRLLDAKLKEIDTLLASDDLDLDTVQELVDALKSAQSELDVILGQVDARFSTLVAGYNQQLQDMADAISRKAEQIHSHAISSVSGLDQALSEKQLALVSGENIKTINGESLLGAGNMVVVPVGCVAHFAMQSAPNGWLKANGAAVSRIAYAKLFAAIGTTFGTGDGSTTFSIPDLRGEFVRGWDDGRAVDTARVLGSSQQGGNAAHNHGAGTLTASSAGGHTHSYGWGMEIVNGGGFAKGSIAYGQVASSSSGEHTHSIAGSTGSQGGEARPRNIALLACIKF